METPARRTGRKPGLSSNHRGMVMKIVSCSQARKSGFFVARCAAYFLIYAPAIVGGLVFLANMSMPGGET